MPINEKEIQLSAGEAKMAQWDELSKIEKELYLWIMKTLFPEYTLAFQRFLAHKILPVLPPSSITDEEKKRQLNEIRENLQGRAETYLSSAYFASLGPLSTISAMIKSLGTPDKETLKNSHLTLKDHLKERKPKECIETISKTVEGITEKLDEFLRKEKEAHKAFRLSFNQVHRQFEVQDLQLSEQEIRQKWDDFCKKFEQLASEEDS